MVLSFLFFFTEAIYEQKMIFFPPPSNGTLSIKDGRWRGEGEWVVVEIFARLLYSVDPCLIKRLISCQNRYLKPSDDQNCMRPHWPLDIQF